MVSQIERYIRKNIIHWPVSVQGDAHWRPLIRSNKEDNGIVDRRWIGQVILWFAEKHSGPCLATKILDRSLEPSAVRDCKVLQERANESIGFPVFPRIFDVVEIAGRLVLFQEAIGGPNYEIELTRTLYGPERSLAAAERVMRRQFHEVANLLAALREALPVNQPRQWGLWAYNLGRNFKANCGFETSVLDENALNKMAMCLDSLPMRSCFGLVDHHTANFFAGPRLVDQIHSSINEFMAQDPELIHAFKFMIAYFRAGPLGGIFKDWLYAMAVASMDERGQTIIGTPVRDLLQKVGLRLDQPNFLWAMLMAAFFTRAVNELEFHGNNPFIIERLRKEFRRYTVTLVKIHSLISNGKQIDPRPILRIQNTIAVENARTSIVFKLVRKSRRQMAVAWCVSNEKLRSFFHQIGATRPR
jgi:hypothetical protein